MGFHFFFIDEAFFLFCFLILNIFINLRVMYKEMPKRQ